MLSIKSLRLWVTGSCLFALRASEAFPTFLLTPSQNARPSSSRARMTSTTVGSSTYPDPNRLSNEYWIEETILSTSGKSEIHRAFKRCQRTGKPYGEPLIIKSSTNIQAIIHEVDNYDRVVRYGGGRSHQGLFVEIYDHLIPNDRNVYYATKAAIVMEMGEFDLYDYIRRNGPLRGEHLRHVMCRVAQCIKACHDAKMVWTEVKSENFVVCRGRVKGIDLESAVPVGGRPIEFTPKACPPELALGYTDGRPVHDKVDYSFDMWSLGTLYYELATGELFHDKSDIYQVADILMRLAQSDMNAFLAEKIADPVLRNLLGGCLRLERHERCNVDQLLQHPYLAQTYQQSLQQQRRSELERFDDMAAQYLQDVDGAVKHNIRIQSHGSSYNPNSGSYYSRP